MTKVKPLLLLSVLFIFSSFTGEINPSKLTGSWQMVSNETFDGIRMSDQYLRLPEEKKEELDDHFNFLLKVIRYNFNPDNKLVYTDAEKTPMGIWAAVERPATWKLEDDMLTIKETSRAFERQAKIVELTDSLLVMQLVIEGEVSNSRLTFKPVQAAE